MHMVEVTKISSKGQVVIPFDIRKELGLDTGSTVVVSKMKDYVLMKKVSIPDISKEFERLSKWGSSFAKKKGVKSEEQAFEMFG